MIVVVLHPCHISRGSRQCSYVFGLNLSVLLFCQSLRAIPLKSKGGGVVGGPEKI